MKITSYPLLFLYFLFPFSLQGSNLKIENMRVVNRPNMQSSPVSVILDIKWDNAWKNARNHDAVWIFMKYGGYWDNHVKLTESGRKILQTRNGSISPMIEVTEGQLGLMIKATYSNFNPHSPIGYLYYGAWSGGPRYISYGYRAGRSANP